MSKTFYTFIAILLFTLLGLWAGGLLGAPPFDESFGWTTRESPTSSPWTSVAYGNNVFVAVGSDGTVMTSTDGGVTWNASPKTAASGTRAWRSVAFGNKTFVAVANSGNRRVMTSADGVKWVLRPSANDALPWRSVAFGNGTFVAVSANGRVMRSGDDGATWSIVPGPPQARWTDVVYGNNLFVASAESRLMTSRDGIKWTARTAPSKFITGMTHGNGLFVAVAKDGATRLFTSPNGIAWTGYTIPDGSWQSVAYGNGLFVAVASTGTTRVLTSKDGKEWIAQETSAPMQMQWSSVAYGDGVFVVVANDLVDKSTKRVMTYSKTVAPPTTVVVVEPASSTVPLPAQGPASTAAAAPTRSIFASIRSFFAALF